MPDALAVNLHHNQNSKKMEVLNNSNRKINPDAGGAFGAGWDIMWKTFVPLFLVTIVYGLISGVGGGFQFNFGDDFQFLNNPEANYSPSPVSLPYILIYDIWNIQNEHDRFFYDLS